MPKSIPIFTFALLLASVAFWPQYLAKNWSSIDGYTHTHAALGTLWLLILLAQPLLIARGHRLAHRITGRASLLIGFSFVASSVLLAHFRVTRMTEAEFAQEGIYIYLPLVVALLFGIACALGFWHRSSTAVHARFMISTGVLLIDPVLARIMFFYLPPLPLLGMYQAITFTLIAIALTLLVRSIPRKMQGRTCYRNYCLGAVSALVLYFAVPHTGSWSAFVAWFRALPLT